MIWLVSLLVAMDPTITGVETPDVVSQWVVTDIASVAVEDQPFQRYIWVPSWLDPQTHYALVYTVNAAASRSGIIQQPVILANGWLQRWDLRTLVQNETELVNLTRAWDSLISQEPYFHDSLTGTISSAVQLRLESLGPIGEASCPVYRGDWFLYKALSSIEGGIYLDLRGLRNTKETDGRSPEELLLARFGVFEKASFEVDGDRRVGMFQSNVTGKARSVIALRSLVGYAWVTEDIFDGDQDVNTHPIYNLLDNNYRGREIIVEMSNGLHAFLITDNNGILLNEAPPNLVADHQVPAPHTKRLQGGAISCIRCHAQEGGLRSCVNDVASILASPLTVLGDSSLKVGTNAFDEIATRYSGRKFDRSILFGRQVYAEAVDLCSGGNLTAEGMGDLVSKIYADHRYTMISSEVALRELGFNLNDPDGVAKPGVVFAQLVDLPEDVAGIRLEDPTIAALYAGISVRRSDFDRVYGWLLARSIIMRTKK